MSAVDAQEAPSPVAVALSSFGSASFVSEYDTDKLPPPLDVLRLRKDDRVEERIDDESV